MLTLGIETSCDETAAAVVRDGRDVLSDVVSTQIDIHRRWGGVVPELASRNHVVQVMPVIDEALSRAKVTLSDIGQIAVTSGPGLQGALLVGLEVGKAMAAARKIPFVGVNHLEGHLLAARLMPDPPEAPLMALIVSGGHTTLYDVPAFGAYHKLGTTRDDAAGEAYDKVAKLIGLPYPGGQPIDALAQKGNPDAIKFPRALPNKEVLDWSFSGLKTAVMLHVQRARRAGRAGPGRSSARAFKRRSPMRTDAKAGARGEEASRAQRRAVRWSRGQLAASRARAPARDRAGGEAVPAEHRAVHRQRSDDSGRGLRSDAPRCRL